MSSNDIKAQIEEKTIGTGPHAKNGNILGIKQT